MQTGVNTMTNILPALDSRMLSAPEFNALKAMPPELEWFANIRSEKTRRAYRNDVQELSRFLGIAEPEEFRLVTRAHLLAWRGRLEERNLAPATIRRKLASISSLFDYLCEQNAVLHNPVLGVKRPAANNNEGTTPALGDSQARMLLDAPPADTLKGKRDRAILATLLYHGLRREELCRLQVRDLQQRSGVPHLHVQGKREKTRYLPLHPMAQRLIDDYLSTAGHRGDLKGPLFRPVKNNTTGTLQKSLDPQAVYSCIIRKYGHETGISALVNGFCVHSLRSTAATNALENGADIAKVQEWLGHANVSTTRLYDRRASRPEESPTFRVKY
jgi:site-specific recombinase XerD